MAEQLYCYKKILLPGGKEAWVREKFNPDEKFLEEPVVLSAPPEYKNGELPHNSSSVVDRLLRNTRLAEERRRGLDTRGASTSPQGHPGSSRGSNRLLGPQRLIEP